MNKPNVFFKPTIEHIVNGLNAMEAQFDLLLAMAIELGVDDEMELLIGLIPQCRDAVSQHYAEITPSNKLTSESP